MTQKISIVLSCGVAIFVSFVAGLEASAHYYIWMTVDLILALGNIVMAILNAKLRGRREIYDKFYAD